MMTIRYRATAALAAVLLSSAVLAGPDYSPSKKAQYPSPNLNRADVDTLVVRGQSSTGEIPKMTVGGQPLDGLLSAVPQIVNGQIRILNGPPLGTIGSDGKFTLTPDALTTPGLTLTGPGLSGSIDAGTVGGTAIPTLLGTKAPLANPTFTGTVTAPAFSGDASAATANAGVGAFPLADWLGATQFNVANVAALRAWPTARLVPGASVALSGYYSAGDNGGGAFTWSPGSKDPDNGCTVIKPTSMTGDGRWLRAVTSELTPRQCGAPGNTTKIARTVTTINGSKTLRVAEEKSFYPSDVGKYFVLDTAGAAGDSLNTKIASYVDERTVTLETAAGSNLTGVSRFITYGNDDAPAISAALAAAPWGGRVTFDTISGYYGAATPIAPGTKPVTISGSARLGSVVYALAPMQALFYLDASTRIGTKVKDLTFDGSKIATYTCWLIRTDRGTYTDMECNNAAPSKNGVLTANIARGDGVNYAGYENTFHSVFAANITGGLAGGESYYKGGANDLPSYNVWIRKTSDDEWYSARGTNAYIANMYNDSDSNNTTFFSPHFYGYSEANDFSPWVAQYGYLLKGITQLYNPIVDTTGSVAGIRLIGDRQRVYGGWSGSEPRWPNFQASRGVQIDPGISYSLVLGFAAGQSADDKKVDWALPRGIQNKVEGMPGYVAPIVDLGQGNTFGTSNVFVSATCHFSILRGNYEFCGGQGHSLTGTASGAFGQHGADFGRMGTTVQSASGFDKSGVVVRGSAQIRPGLLRGVMTSSAAIVLTTDGGPGAGYNQLDLPQDAASGWYGSWGGDIRVVCRYSNGDTGMIKISDVLASRTASGVQLVSAGTKSGPSLPASMAGLNLFVGVDANFPAIQLSMSAPTTAPTSSNPLHCVAHAVPLEVLR